MALIPAICTQCGAQIRVDDTHEAGICQHCGTAFITEKVIKKYSIYNINNNNFVGANINMNLENELEKLICAADGFYKLKEYDNALSIYERITEEYPQDVRGWVGCVNNYMRGEFCRDIPICWEYSWIDIQPFSRWLNNAYILSDKNIQDKLNESRNTYINAIEKKWKDFRYNLSVSSLIDFVGNEIYSYYEKDDIRDLIYAFNDKLFYQISRNDEYGILYVTFEIISISRSGNIKLKFIKSGNRGFKKNYAKDWFEIMKCTQLEMYYYDCVEGKRFIKLYIDDELVDMSHSKWVTIYGVKDKNQGWYSDKY